MDRQHIVRQHKRNDPTAFGCDRCTRHFASRKALRDHQRVPLELMCPLVEYDPEWGIDGPTATRLLSRKRLNGMSIEEQWREIWGLLFPEDREGDVRSYGRYPENPPPYGMSS